ncbi:MAG: hypothetical protein MGU50_16175 [Trichodesmium sp. MAG_R02]|jgi:ribosomal protein L30/L7E|nr:hypothetical protein [Trichodesmium sp. MAG_R02]
MSDDQKQNDQANYENHIHERELDPKELAEMLRIRKFNEGDEYQNRTVNHISERPLTPKNLEMLIELEMLREVAKIKKELNEDKTKRAFADVLLTNFIASIWFISIVSTNPISNSLIIRTIPLIIAPQVTLLKGVISHYFKNKG